MLKVLIPTDFSRNAYHALKFALSISDMQKEMHLILLNSYHLLPSSSEMFISIDDILHKNSQNGLKREIEQLKKDVKSPSFSYDLVSYCGQLKNGIKKAISNYDVDLIVMGTNGASGIQKFVVGSNATTIISEINKPVIVIPDQKDLNPIKSIVLALDYRHQINWEAIEHINRIGRLIKADIKIITVTADSEVDKDVQKFSKELSSKNLDLDVLSGESVIESIISYIKDNNADLLAILPNRLEPIEQFFHKSISKEIAMRAEVPMMAIH